MEAPLLSGCAHDLDALAGLIRPATRLLYLNQPHNPTGTLIARPVFEHVIALARAHALVVFSDEVYPELEHDPASRCLAACDQYERAVSLGSISKSYGLPGLRIGWIATRDAGLRDAVATLKDYTTICASAPSEFLTALALRHRQSSSTATSRSCGATCRSSTASSSGTPEPLRGSARRQARSASPASPGSVTSTGTANSSPRPVSCSFQGRSTTSRAMSASALVGPTCPMPSKSSRRTLQTASTAPVALASRQSRAARTRHVSPAAGLYAGIATEEDDLSEAADGELCRERT